MSNRTFGKDKEIVCLTSKSGIKILKSIQGISTFFIKIKIATIRKRWLETRQWSEVTA